MSRSGQRSTPPLAIRERQGSARDVSSQSAAHAFHNRARLYESLDSRLHAKTRFFGAACVTNRVLVHLAQSRSALARAEVCADWLSELGAALETVNRSIADALFDGSLAGPALDERIVSLEQSVVEHSLRKGRISRMGAYRDVLPAVDAVLNQSSWLSAFHFSPAVRWYRRVLGGVRQELASPLQFEQQSHRERIGMALISALRRDASDAAMLPT